MHSFHPFGSGASSQRSPPQTPQQQLQGDSSNPFSNPRLLESSTPRRHASPYELARAHQTTSTQAAFAQAERAADHSSNSGIDAAGRLSSTSETDAYLASLVQGGSEDLKRLSLGTSSGGGGGGFSPQRPPASHRSPLGSHAAAAAAAGYSSPPRSSHAFAASSAAAAHSPLLSGPRGGSESQEQFYYDLLKHAREGDCAAVQSLLQSAAPTGFDVDYTDRDGDSALHRACAGGHLPMAHLLVLDYGASIHATNRHGDTPLLVNMRSATPHAALVRFLVECGSDIHATNAMGVSAASCVAAGAQSASAAKPIHALHSGGFVFGSSALSLSPARPGSSAAPSASDLSSVLQEAQANPVRQFVLNQSEELRQCRAQLEAANAQLQAQQIAGQQLEAQRATQDSQLRNMHASLTACHTRLAEMDAGLDRLSRDQTDAAAASGATTAPAPVVLISEVRGALIRVRNSFQIPQLMRSARPGSGYQAAQTAVGAQAGAITYDRAKRKLVTLDDDDDRSAVVSAAAAAAAGEIDPLDAFMASLQPAVSAAAAPKPVPEPAEEMDPLDSYMLSLTSAPAPSSRSAASTAAAPSASAVSSKRLELDDDDAQASYLASSEHRRAQKLGRLERQAQDQGVSLDSLLASRGADSSDDDRDRRGDDDDEDNDGSAPRSASATSSGAAAGSKKRDNQKSLAAVDHSAIAYPPFRKAFYTEHADLTALPEQEMKELTEDFDVQLSGPIHPRLCYSFAHFGFPAKLLAVIARQPGFTAPTPIQAASIPCALSGCDVIALAQTGSGKSCAFLWPLIVHVADQRPLAAGEGPIGLILAPTRELAEQIYAEAYKYLQPFALRITPVMGGMQKFEQVRSLAKGSEIVVASPGRLVDLIAEKAMDCRRITFVCLDEADRMFSLGFETALRSILAQIRPDAQKLLFSATFNPRVESLARAALHNPVRILVGTGGANKSIRQVVDVLPTVESKWEWLHAKLGAFLAAGPVLVFCATIAGCEELTRRLKAAGIPAGSLHGDHTQLARQSTVRDFKAGKMQILVATDVASRGLDIKKLPTVVCYDVARSIDAHTHRIGRTGRAGLDGMAYTLLCKDSASGDAKYAPMLYENVEEAEQEIPQALWEMAYADKQWSRGRSAQALRGGGVAGARGGRGGGGAGGRGGSGGGGGSAARGGMFAPSYNAVAPPTAAASTAAAFANSMHAVQSFKQAYQLAPAASTGALPPPPAVSFPGGVHPSRLAQIPGAAAAAASASAAAPAAATAASAAAAAVAAFAARHSAASFASPPSSTLPLPPPPPSSRFAPPGAGYPAPPPPPPPSMPAVTPGYPSAAPQQQHAPAPMIHPSRMGLVPASHLPPPPPPPPPPSASQPAALGPDGAPVPPKKKSRWGN